MKTRFFLAAIITLAPWFIFTYESMLSSRPQKAPLWNATKLVLPLSFGLPEDRFAWAKNLTRPKTCDFAPIIPGVKSTYTFSNEESYYDAYASAYFGITFQKWGWDCFRHYEIIAAGSMPYFLNHTSLPHNTMHDFPFDIVQQAMELPGVPSQEDVREAMATGSTAELKIDQSKFNENRYQWLLQEIVTYSLEYLTWEAKPRYILSNIQKNYPCLTEPRVLIVTTKTCEYMSCTIFGGFYALLGPPYMSSLFGPKFQLFDSLAPKKSRRMYGKGFSYSRVFFDSWDHGEMDRVTQERLKKGFFNMVIFANGENHYCDQTGYFKSDMSQVHLLYKYQRKFNPLVVLIDGNDIVGCHKFFTRDDHPLEYHAHFIREFQQARSEDDSLPVEWSGCKRHNAAFTRHQVRKTRIAVQRID